MLKPPETMSDTCKSFRSDQTKLLNCFYFDLGALEEAGDKAETGLCH